MPAQPKIDKVRLLQLDNEGKSNKEIAQYFNCSVYAVEHAKKALKKKAKNLPVLTATSDDNIDSMAQLSFINSTIINELKRCSKFIFREEERQNTFDLAVAELELDPNNKELQQRVSSLAQNFTAGIMKIQTNVIAISGEVRKQIELQIKIAETLYNIQMNQEFQMEVINTIKELDPKAAAKIITRLKERRAIRGLVKG